MIMSSAFVVLPIRFTLVVGSLGSTSILLPFLTQDTAWTQEPVERNAETLRDFGETSHIDEWNQADKESWNLGLKKVQSLRRER